jgi:hypothetical protein
VTTLHMKKEWGPSHKYYTIFPLSCQAVLGS